MPAADVPQGAAAGIMGLLDRANSLQAWKALLGNHPEKLRDDHAGQHSIRVNKRWRVCFVWRDGNAVRIELCDCP
jgi:proteic killer suppression protein